MKEVEKRVIDQLMRLEVLFDKVAILCRAIGRYGLFNGQVDYDGEFKFFPFRENESCIDFVYDPEAYALELSCATYPDGNWYCLLVSEDDQNSVMLGFSTETGDLMEVDPDDNEHSYIWDSKDVNKRKAQIRSLARGYDVVDVYL